MRRTLALAAATAGLALHSLPDAPAIEVSAAARTAAAAQDPVPPDMPAERCGRCHDQVHAEWRDSAHGKAHTDPVFQRALATRRRPALCLPCHVPGPVLARLGQMPRQRDDRRDEGVTCASCHVRDGVVHGPHGGTTDAHPTTEDPTFGRRGSVALCTGCHDLRIGPVLPLARDFVAADLLAEDLSCVGCHMATVRRPPARDPVSGQPVGETRSGRSHRLLGPDDAEFCASAFDVRLAPREAGERGYTVLVTNGAGHRVPGLAGLRRFDLRVQLLDRAGDELAQRRWPISWQDPLLVDEERRLDLPARPGAVALRVVVDHLFDGRKLATVVDRTLELP